MSITSRNAPCPCGSGKKYKRCCLGKDFQNNANRPTGGPKPPKYLILTQTGELFQRVRLYYSVPSRAEVEAHFSKLQCMYYREKNDRWEWLYASEARKLRFKYKYASIPRHLHPLILGAFHFCGDNEMLLDVRSIERAYQAVPFFDNYIVRTVARLTTGAILNELPVVTKPIDTRLPGANHELDCDALFEDPEMFQAEPAALIREIETRVKVVDNTHDKRGGIAPISTKEAAQTALPRVEKFPIHYYDEGIDQLKGALILRQTVAIKHWEGEEDYTTLDALMTAVNLGKFR